MLPSALVGLAAGILLADEAAGAIAPSVLAVIGCAALLTLADGGQKARRPGRRRLAAGVAAALSVGLLVGALRQGQTALPVGPASVAGHVGGQPLTIQGTLSDEPRPRGDRMLVVLDAIIASEVEAGAGHALSGRLLVWLPRSQPLSAGDRVSFTAALEAPRDFDGFGYRAYLRRQGIGAIARAYEVRVVGRSAGPLGVLAALRQALLGGLNRLVPEPEAALGAGILLGVRSGIAPEIEDAFATAGLTHVVAISGWNIAIVAALMARLVRRLPGIARGRGTRSLLLGCAVGGYVVLTGASPSVVRAALMAGAMLVAQLSGSTAHALSALMLAAVAMLLATPAVLWDIGFQLSCLATAGLILLGPGIERRLAGWPALIREPVALTTAAQLATLPIIVGSFDRLSLVAPAANVVVAPLMPLVMATSAAVAFAATLGLVELPLVGELVGWLLGGSAWLYLRCMILAGTGFASIPLAAIDVSLPPLLLFAWYPLLGLAWRARHGGHPSSDVSTTARPLSLARRQRGPAMRALTEVAGRARATIGRAGVRALVVGTLAVLGVTHLATLPDGRLHITVLDVGQGDSILIESPSGRVVLVDGGPDPERTLRRIGEALPFHRRGLDLVLLTHPHQDHVAGLVEVLARYRVSLVLHGGRPYDNPAYDALLYLAAHEGPGLTNVARVATAGIRLWLDPTTSLEILYPARADLSAPPPEGDINNASVVALLGHGSFTALLTGDAEAPVERLLLDRGALEPIDLLKVGHHGSDSSSTPAFLAATRPVAAVVSVGAINKYGHPSPRTLAALRAIPGLRLYRTDLHGDVEIVSDGLRSWVMTERQKTGEPG